jgi:hypothetical protein
MEIACPGMFGSVVPIVTFDELPTVLTTSGFIEKLFLLSY